MNDEHESIASRVRQSDFVSVMRMISSLDAEKPKHGTALRVVDEAVRLSQKPSLSFRGPMLDELVEATGKHPLRLFVNFQGLFGTNGPLPLHYTEYADRRRRHDRDATFYEFIDLFNHRLLSLFYRAIAEFDPSINFDHPDTNNFDVFIGSLAGFGLGSSHKRDGVPDYAKFMNAAWMGNSTKCPDGIEAIVGNYFDVDVTVSEFVGAWLPLPSASRNKLGGNGGNFVLGESAYVGSRIWSIGHKFKLSIGPLSWREYLSFKPGGKRAAELFDLVRNYIGDEWDWDLELVLQQGEVAPLSLDRKSSLGFTCWLASSRSEKLSMQNVSVNKQTISSVNH